MKSFIRSLNIEERKTLICAISFTIFQTLSAFLNKAVMVYYNINRLTLFSELGSLLSLICFCRIILLIKNNEKKRQEILNLKNIQNILLKGFVGCLMLGSMIFSISSTSITNYFAIIKIWPFIYIMSSHFIFGNDVKGYQIICSVVDLIGIAMIIYSEEPGGLIYSLIVAFLYALFDIINKLLHRTNLDSSVLYIGVFSAVIGTMANVIYTKEIESIYLTQWIVILFNAFFTYYSILFQTKVMKKFECLNIVFPFTLVSILLSILLDFFFLDELITVHEVFGVIILSINTVYYSVQVIELTQKRKNEVIDLHEHLNK